jgi:outer membrane protein assembly factor BamE
MSEPHSRLHRRCVRLGLLLATSVSLVACGAFNSTSTSIAGLITPYKMDVVQGNFVSKEQVAALTTGMSRVQVRNVLGSPLVTSAFHADRWDYVFSLRRRGELLQSRRLTVYFKGDAMERFEADPMPTEAEFVASLGTGRRGGTVPVLEASEEDLKKFPAVASPVETKALPPLPASYPPLEPASR